MARSEKRQRTAIVASRLTVDEAARVRAVAARRGLSVSALIRDLLLAALPDPEGP